MNAAAIEWLPKGSLAIDVVLETFEQTVKSWSDRWFRAPYLITRIDEATTDARYQADKYGWYIFRSLIAIRGKREAYSRMICNALDRAELGDLSDADTALIAGLERKILDNLSEELEAAIGVRYGERPVPLRVVDPFSPVGGLELHISDRSGREHMILAVPLQALNSFIKDHYKKYDQPIVPLKPLAQAMENVTLPIEASIGNVELTLPELNELAVGDVLMLDTAINRGVDIRVANSQIVFAKAKLTNIGSDVALEFDPEL